MNAKPIDDEEEAFLAAFDKREAERIEASLNVRIHSSVAKAERDRVRAILDRDRAEHNREAYRKQAEQQVANGDFSNFADTVIEPTPEWLEKGPTRSFVPKQPEGTVRVVRSVRRVKVPVLVKLCSDGRLGYEEMLACRHYRETYEATGLEGRVTIGRYGIQGQLPGSGTVPSARLPITEWEIAARDAFRAARRAIPAKHRAFFEAVVLGDQSPRAARRGVRNGLETKLLASLAHRLVKHYQGMGLDLARTADESGH